MLENLGRDPAAAYYADLAFLKPADTRLLMGLAPDRDPESSPVYQEVTAPYRRCPSASALQRAEYADLKVYMPNDPLVKVDRMSMAHGLEVRSPLLDRRVFERWCETTAWGQMFLRYAQMGPQGEPTTPEPAVTTVPASTRVH